jgi:hypothetical protein
VTAAHTVTVELDGDGTPGLVRFGCTGGPADECHQWCAEGCEEQCDGMPIRLWSPGQDAPELVAQAPAQGHRWEPMPPDGASCRLVDWLDGTGDWRDTYDGEDYDAPQPLRPGTHVIAVYWDGDDYTWHYAADDEEPAIPGRPL